MKVKFRCTVLHITVSDSFGIGIPVPFRNRQSKIGMARSAFLTDIGYNA